MEQKTVKRVPKGYVVLHTYFGNIARSIDAPHKLLEHESVLKVCVPVWVAIVLTHLWVVGVTRQQIEQDIKSMAKDKKAKILCLSEAVLKGNLAPDYKIAISYSLKSMTKKSR